MAVYAQPSDLSRFGAMASAFTSIAPDVQKAAIADASRTADGYLKSRYPMPLLEWDQDLTACVCKIATYEIFCVRGFNPGAGADVNIRMRYDDAIRWLKEVSRQELHPRIVPTQAAGPVPQQPKVITKCRRGF